MTLGLHHHHSCSVKPVNGLYSHLIVKLCIVCSPLRAIHSSDCFFAPATGCRNESAGALNAVGARCYSWSSSPFSATSSNGGRLWCTATDVNPLNNNNRSLGQSVRCVQHLRAVRLAALSRVPLFLGGARSGSALFRQVLRWLRRLRIPRGCRLRKKKPSERRKRGKEPPLCGKLPADDAKIGVQNCSDRK